MASLPLAASALAPATLAAVGRPFIERHLPAPLLAEGPRGLLWWQWLALPVVIVVALMAGAALGWVARRILGHLAARTQTRWDDELIERLRGPVAMLCAIGVFTALRPALDIDADADAAAVISHVLRAAIYFVVFWGGFRSLDLAFDAAASAPRTKGNANLTGLLPLGRKIGKILLLAIGLVSVLDSLGFQVASLIAGLGIGGVALALAAQKTVENLFGSVAIGVDQPFRVGDFVKIEDVIGTVESIGMRSTRVRTLDRTLVTFPNGKLADTRAETFAVRDRLRILVNLGLAHGTSAAQVRAVLAGIEAALRAHPRIWPEGTSVRLTEVREWSLNVEVMAWLQLTDWSAFTAERQELLLRFLAVVEEAGASLAFPTRTVRLVAEGGGERGGTLK
jgi:MscS family membrane protein